MILGISYKFCQEKLDEAEVRKQDVKILSNSMLNDIGIGTSAPFATSTSQYVERWDHPVRHSASPLIGFSTQNYVVHSLSGARARVRVRSGADRKNAPAFTCLDFCQTLKQERGCVPSLLSFRDQEDRRVFSSCSAVGRPHKLSV